MKIVLLASSNFRGMGELIGIFLALFIYSICHLVAILSILVWKAGWPKAAWRSGSTAFVASLVILGLTHEGVTAFPYRFIELLLGTLVFQLLVRIAFLWHQPALPPRFTPWITGIAGVLFGIIVAIAVSCFYPSERWRVLGSYTGERMWCPLLPWNPTEMDRLNVNLIQWSIYGWFLGRHVASGRSVGSSPPVLWIVVIHISLFFAKLS